ncbi:hypothetical protein XSR1_200054 [Xenorhabdus szentirmaii DSM 16338]|uniref:Uncharacterized protein n=1 Tax=Xenorhabdus szentirmaii DSM 16338 TaxID=1427518 RepID=W1IZA5_9GAMM|nr:hypothetical protein XSR1_200054 [Xenorhabdus szentirmaii DSM 16338]
MRITTNGYFYEAMIFKGFFERVRATADYRLASPAGIEPTTSP